MSSSGGNFTEFGELVLIIGDFYVPFKKPDIPPVFKELLNTDKIKTVLCTGNVCSDEIVDRLKAIANNVHIVKGDFDTTLTSELPESITVQVGHFKVGLIHGHQIVPWGNHEALEDRMRKMDVDILVYGHTHVNEIFQSCTGKYLINPGSVTGIRNQVGPTSPSFMLMAVQGPSAAIYVYELGQDGKANVAMSEIRKAS
jgi:vacuolar protein sorting-associated protein 29